MHAIWQPDEFKAASGVVVKSDGDDRSIPRLDEAIDSGSRLKFRQLNRWTACEAEVF